MQYFSLRLAGQLAWKEILLMSGQNKVSKIQLRQKTAIKILIIFFPISDSSPPPSLSLYLSVFHYVNM